MSIDVYATVSKYVGISYGYDNAERGVREMGFEYANCTESRRNRICETKVIRYRVDVTL